VISGRASEVSYLHELMAKTGPDPKAWLPQFMQRERRAA